MKKLSMIKVIIIMKQRKGQGVIVMNQAKNILASVCQYTKLDHNPVATLENKVHRTSRLIYLKTFTRNFILRDQLQESSLEMQSCTSCYLMRRKICY